jgi:hypothetical protein
MVSYSDVIVHLPPRNSTLELTYYGSGDRSTQSKSRQKKTAGLVRESKKTCARRRIISRLNVSHATSPEVEGISMGSKIS